MTKPPIFLGYVRLSRLDTKDRNDTEGTDRQIARLTAWATERDAELELYVEPDGHRSGGSILHRPAYQQLLARLTSGRPGELAGVVATDLDRTGRKERDMHDLFDEVVTRGLRLIVLDDPTLNLESTDGRFMAGLKVLLAAQERRKASDRIKTALHFRQAQGLYVGALPYGYQWTQEVGERGVIKVLEPNPVEAERLTAIYHKYLEGGGCDVVARWVNGLGWPTNKGNTWRGISIYWLVEHVLTYRGYVLTRNARREITGMIEGKHPPLIDAALADAVQIEHRSRTSSNKGGRQAVYSYPLVHVLWCGECGSHIVGATRNFSRGKRITPRFAYRCMKELADCASSQAGIDVVEGQVWPVLFALRDQVIAASPHMTGLADLIPPRLPEPSGVGAVRAEMDRLNTMFQKGRIAEERYDRSYAELERKLALAEASIVTIGSARDPLGVLAFLKLVADIEAAIAVGDRRRLGMLARGAFERIEFMHGKVVLCRLTPPWEYLRSVVAGWSETAFKLDT